MAYEYIAKKARRTTTSTTLQRRELIISLVRAARGIIICRVGTSACYF